MVKKVLINITLIFIAFVIYFLQSDFFSWFSISGIKPNLFVIYILWIGLFGNRIMGIAYGLSIGLFLDVIFCEKIGANLLGLTLIGFLAILFDRNFSKDSRMTIMSMVFGATIIFEVVIFIMNYIMYGTNVEVWQFIQILMVEVVYNIMITIIIYPILQRFGYVIENEYKGNKILTRYF